MLVVSYRPEVASIERNSDQSVKSSAILIPAARRRHAAIKIESSFLPDIHADNNSLAIVDSYQRPSPYDFLISMSNRGGGIAVCLGETGRKPPPNKGPLIFHLIFSLRASPVL